MLKRDPNSLDNTKTKTKLKQQQQQQASISHVISYRFRSRRKLRSLTDFRVLSPIESQSRTWHAKQLNAKESLAAKEGREGERIGAE